MLGMLPLASTFVCYTILIKIELNWTLISVSTTELSKQLNVHTDMEVSHSSKIIIETPMEALVIHSFKDVSSPTLADVITERENAERKQSYIHSQLNTYKNIKKWKKPW